MKYLLIALILVSSVTSAADNWVICKNPTNGLSQQFKRQCPIGWIFIGNGFIYEDK